MRPIEVSNRRMTELLNNLNRRGGHPSNYVGWRSPDGGCSALTVMQQGMASSGEEPIALAHNLHLAITDPVGFPITGGPFKCKRPSDVEEKSHEAHRKHLIRSGISQCAAVILGGGPGT